MNVMVNIKNIKNEIQKCDNYVLDLQDKRAEMKKLVSEIENIWKENEYKQFSLKMTDFMDELKNFEEQLSSYNQFVNGYIEAEKTVNNNYVNKKINIE